MKFNQTSLCLNKILREGVAGVELTDLSKLYAASLAFAIARKLPLPSTEVENIGVHYVRNFAVAATSEAISQLNELFIIDIAYAQKLVEAFYSIRYTAAHPGACPLSLGAFDFFCTVSGVSLFIDQASYEFVTKYKKEIVCLSNCFFEILE